MRPRRGFDRACGARDTRRAVESRLVLDLGNRQFVADELPAVLGLALQEVSGIAVPLEERMLEDSRVLLAAEPLRCYLTEVAEACYCDPTRVVELWSQLKDQVYESVGED